jgi:Putative sensor
LNDSALTRFFCVVARPQTWLGILFHVLAFPLGLFYFVFLITGLAVGVGLVVVWVGIPILLVVAGAWWLFGAFERVQARYLLDAAVSPPPREWEKVDGIWGKLRAHFGSGATWMDLLYLFAKLVLGSISFMLLVVAVALVGWFFAIPFFTAFDEPIVNGTWVPPLWFGILAVPLGILSFFVSLHVLNGWSWVCARWAEVMFRGAAPAASAAASAPPVPTMTAPRPGVAPIAPVAPPQAPPAPTMPSPPVPAVPAPPAAAAPPRPPETAAPQTSDDQQPTITDGQPALLSQPGDRSPRDETSRQ